jgi:hypothetical protein
MKTITIPVSNHSDLQGLDKPRNIVLNTADTATDGEILALVQAAMAMSEGAVSGYTVTQWVDLAAPQSATTPGAGHRFARVSNRLEFSLRTASHKSPAKMGVPAPKEAILNNNQTIDTADALVTAFFAALLEADGVGGGDDAVNDPVEVIAGELFINN